MTQLISSYSYSKFSIFHYDIMENTMDPHRNYDNDTIIIVDKVIAGKAKGDRKWTSGKNALLFSMKIAIQDNKDYNCLVFLIAVAMRQAIECKYPDIDIKNKWPNDLILNDKKVCGILVEQDFHKETIILGLGINLDEHPNGAMFEATSLLEEGYIIDKNELFHLFIDKFVEFYEQWMKFGFVGIQNLWMQKAYKINKEINVKRDNFEYNGIFKGLNKYGALIIQTPEGEKKVYSGDIF